MKYNNIYVLDTSALIDNPHLYKNFHKSECLIPLATIDELDKLKKLTNYAGKNARLAIRALDEVSQQGDISKGVIVEGDILVRIQTKYVDLKQKKFEGFGDPTYGDTQILALAFETYQSNKNTILVSNDFNLRLKARSRGIKAIEFTDLLKMDDLYSGMKIIKEEDKVANELFHSKEIEDDFELLTNQCAIFNSYNDKNIAVGRKTSSGMIKLIEKSYPWDLKPRNVEQTCAIDMILDPTIDLVSLVGIAGSGKTLLTCACALELVFNQKKYEKFLIFRPMVSVGAELGFLPGIENEKLEPWMRPIMDSFELLFNSKKDKKDKRDNWKVAFEMFQKQGRIQMEAISFIRGRSIHNSLILIDESQNISQQEIKTILTRAGDNSKIILTGDISQIDNDALDATNNGLTYVVEKFKNSSLAGHITFTKGERSRLATEAANLL